MFTSYMLLAIMCFADEPNVCQRVTLGTASDWRMCREMAKSAKRFPPKGYIVKQTACVSGGVEV